ncbi:unnamed protein product [marine sediment metagenome]|uniref:Uncharacterized protein n=1 Tax=marine sediment metagenome TaxID=412755 RepID=X1U7X9_9ZZZZ
MADEETKVEVSTRTYRSYKTGLQKVRLVYLEDELTEINLVITPAGGKRQVDIYHMNKTQFENLCQVLAEARLEVSGEKAT